MGCWESTHSKRLREHNERKYRKYKPFRPLAKPCKSGYLLYYSKETGKWKRVFAVLFEDSTLAWFMRPKRMEPIQSVKLKSVCSMMLVGPVCYNMHWNPRSVPKKLSYDYMFAFPREVVYELMPNALRTIYYFLCPNGKLFGEWLTSIAATLGPIPKTIPSKALEKGKQLVMVPTNKGKSGFWGDVGIGHGYNKPWEWGWSWCWDYHPNYGWGYGDFEIGRNVDLHDTNLVPLDTESMASFGGSDFQDYAETIQNDRVNDTVDQGNINSGQIKAKVDSSVRVDTDKGITGIDSDRSFNPVDLDFFGLADYEANDAIISGWSSGGGATGGGGSDFDTGVSWGGGYSGGGVDSGVSDSGGASCGGGGCGGGGCGGGGGGDF